LANRYSVNLAVPRTGTGAPLWEPPLLQSRLRTRRRAPPGRARTRLPLSLGRVLRHMTDHRPHRLHSPRPPDRLARKVCSVTCSRTGSSGPPSCAGVPGPRAKSSMLAPITAGEPASTRCFMGVSSRPVADPPETAVSRANYTSLHGGGYGPPPPGVSDVTRDPCRASWSTRASRPMIDRPLRGNRKRNPRGRGRREPNSARTGGLPPSRVFPLR
jgi:hypothetical protein